MKCRGVEFLIDKINDGVGNVVSFLTLAIGIIIVYEIIMRYVFNAPTFWVHDIAHYLFGITFMFGGAYALLHDAHVNMDMLYRQITGKPRFWLDIINGLCILVFALLLVWLSAKMAMESVKYREIYMESAWSPPIYPMKVIFFISSVGLLLQSISNLIKAFRQGTQQPEQGEN